MRPGNIKSRDEHVSCPGPPGRGITARIRIDLARTNESVTLDGEIKWLKVKEGDDLYELGVGFRNLKSHTILALLRHLYGQNTGIPSSIA